MKTISSVLVLALVAALGFLVGRTTAPVAPSSIGRRSAAMTATPSPASTAALVPRKYRSILRYFAAIDEGALPTKGILGGTMIPVTVAFPKGFSDQPGELFYVVGSDGHLLETWSYKIRKQGRWRHMQTRQGLKPVDFERHLEDYDVYRWRPPYYVAAED